ncbi:MAG TPA: proton-conducting transporter membrane subunit, partial [Saprospiraceae bacterium]|nr:proton-conducting transporter membrane subunit [Saprospiraceae bacterium]
MSLLLQLLILIPAAGLLLSAFPDNKHERWLFGIAIGTVTLHLSVALVYAVWWLMEGAHPMLVQGPVLYQAGDAEFAVQYYFDYATMAYGTVCAAITFLVAIFSRYYMHRERGFKRFFNNLLLFYLGLNIILVAGNFETLFMGWEVIGIASFFLIAFYRDRYLPVKNALKVISLYRVADVFLLLAIWGCHHVFTHSVSFLDLHDMADQHRAIVEQPTFQLLIPAMFLVVALVKSAQLPFSSWLPRAMEGPTTSSAIFYGSLSVHMGAFLLLRTWAFWADNLIFRGLVIMLGLMTVVVATSISRVQASVKTQIAYSSIAQIGLIFIETALGLHWLALLHFAGNAFLRTYQLLVSPSVLNYLIHDQFFNFIPPQHDDPKTFWGRVKLSFYVLAIKEWNLDSFMTRLLWNPLKQAGRALGFLASEAFLWIAAPVFLGGLYLVYHQDLVPAAAHHWLPIVFSGIGVLLSLRAFAARGDARRAWLLIIMNQLFTSLSVGFNDQFDYTQVHIFLSGIVVSAALGYWCLWRLLREGESITLDRFHGHSYERPRLTVLFLIACLGLAGFPITPTFIGEDLLLGHIHDNQIALTVLTALGLLLDGIVVFRLYGRLFLGPHERGYHEVA